MKKILVYHDMGAPSHYRALLESVKGKSINVEFAEFSFIKSAAKAILNRKWSPVKRSLQNLVTYVLLSLGIKRPSTIILGIAPFDWRILTLAPVLLLNRVHLHTSWPYWDGSFNAMQPRLPGVMAFWRLALRYRVKHVYFVTQAAKDNYLKAGFHLESFSIVHHSISVDIYKNIASRSKDKVSIGYVGRLEESKGILEFIQIAKAMNSANFEFFVAGAGSKMDLVLEAQKAGLLNYLGQISSQQALAEFYNKLTFLLLPSKRTSNWEELFGMVIIEAAACGVLSIVTDHIGPKEIVEKLKHGIIFEETTFVEEAIAFLNSMKISPETASISTKAQELYSEKHLSSQWVHSHSD